MSIAWECRGCQKANASARKTCSGCGQARPNTADKVANATSLLVGRILNLLLVVALAVSAYFAARYLFAEIWGVGIGQPGSPYAAQHAPDRALPVALAVFVGLIIAEYRRASRDEQLQLFTYAALVVVGGAGLLLLVGGYLLPAFESEVTERREVMGVEAEGEGQLSHRQVPERARPVPERFVGDWVLYYGTGIQKISIGASGSVTICHLGIQGTLTGCMDGAAGGDGGRDERVRLSFPNLYITYDIDCEGAREGPVDPITGNARGPQCRVVRTRGMGLRDEGTYVFAPFEPEDWRPLFE
jgi:hypothetical protein